MSYKKQFYKLLTYSFLFVCSTTNILSAQKKEKEHYVTGIATWYSNNFNGRKTASGEIFSQKKLTCATNKFKIGTWLRVESVTTKKIVLVRVNDRMAKHPHKIIDLTWTAAVALGITRKGVARVRIEDLGMKKPEEIN